MVSLKTKITTPLLEQSRLFYESVLGMTTIEEWDDPEDRGVILALDPSTREALLEVYHGPSQPNLEALSLQFKVDDVGAFARWLPADTPYEGPTLRPWGSTYLYLRDPNNIQIIIYEGNW